MKHIVYALAISAAALLGACSGGNKTSNATPSPEAGPDGIVTLTDADYYTPGAPVDRLTIIDFNALWCGPCRQLTPVFHELAEAYKGKATFVSVDVDSVPGMMERFDMGDGIPAVLFIRPDGTTEKYIGTGELLPYEKFAALIDKNLK